MTMDNDTSPGLSFTNIEYIEEQQARFQENPASVDASWHHFFTTLNQIPQGVSITSKQIRPQFPKIDSGVPDELRIYNLIQAYRTYGHLLAHTNPVEVSSSEPPKDPWQLNLERLGFSREDLTKNFPTRGLLPSPTASLQEIIDTLKEIYCNTIGIEYIGLQNPQLEEWLQQRIEPTRFKMQMSNEQRNTILQQLNQAELLETFLHIKYTGQKRFSLEGGETLIPILNTLIDTGSQLGLETLILGMAHRGRLNVLTNILKKSYIDIFSEFEEGYIPSSFEGSGDVKYHKGFSAEVKTASGRSVEIFLSPNPSHLESVDPVVEGLTRAKQEQKGKSGAVKCALTKQADNDSNNTNKVIPILIHGDAALAGQGVVYETMQLYRLQGYSTGGTIHIVINNHIGFTSTPKETQSTPYCTDIARAFYAPVFHVNAEDPEGCVFATQLAMQLRQKFHCDVFIDLNCYRKYGHNEGDEPTFTQPLEYQIIRKKKSIRELYRDTLVQQSVVEKEIVETMEAEYTQALQKALQESKETMQQSAANGRTDCSDESPSKKEDPFAPIVTSVATDILQKVAERLCFVPEGFSPHPKLVHLLKERRSMIISGSESEKAKPIDWGMAELLAYGTLLWNGIHIRLAGQDTRRGTFSHRHATWMDQKKEQAYCPLQYINENQGCFDVYNSPVSEFACLGFEFGYSCGYPEALVIWEAQFGDFCNGAQIIIDQYIATTEHKWSQHVGLVLLLPHGYEGQGPEHSSARIERFLELAGNHNMRIVNPTTPAQLFHLLRRQVLNPAKKPLIVFTPKGLLRHPACISNLQDLTEGGFKEIIDDPAPPEKVQRVAFCSGRIYYDIIAEREKRSKQKSEDENLAVVRIEQLFPLNIEALASVILKYRGVKELLWVQEEPSNMGAWEYMFPILLSMVSKNVPITYVGRERSASPAVGSHALHKQQHIALMAALFKGLE